MISCTVVNYGFDIDAKFVFSNAFKGEKVLKVNFLRRTLTTFEFSRQNDTQFLAKIDISACQNWLKLRFGMFEIVEIPSFWI